MSESAPSDETKKLRDGLTKLGQDACRLRLLMRRSKSNAYHCVTVPRDDQMELCESLADAFGVYGNVEPSEAKHVAFTLFGALIKDVGEGRQVVLEKAQVILH